MKTDPHLGQRFTTYSGGTEFSVTEIRQRTVHFRTEGDTEPRRINRERWDELFSDGTLIEAKATH